MGALGIQAVFLVWFVRESSHFDAQRGYLYLLIGFRVKVIGFRVSGTVVFALWFGLLVCVAAVVAA